MGGEFHWMGLPSGPFVPLPAPAAWYLLARHAVVALLRFLSPRPRRLWVPSYFCFDVADYWRSFSDVAVYTDGPCRSEPDWPSLTATRDDLVIAVNYFGVRDGEAWQEWREQHQCVVVEDHSHDPVSRWARESTAQYAFASLRKTLPVPDGGLLWSPHGLDLPPRGASTAGASFLKLAAMLWKREYLTGAAPAEAKEVYRRWQHQGEESLDAAADVQFASELTQQYLCSGVPRHWREQRIRNTQYLLAEVGEYGSRAIFRDWPEYAAPLGLVLEMRSHEQRDTVREGLQAHSIYCPVHWPPTPSTKTEARALSGRLLTIPTDQRYGPEDMDRVARVLRELLEQNR